MLGGYGSLFRIACAMTEACVNAEPAHLSHHLRDFANLLTPDSAVELSKWTAVSLTV